MVGLTWHCCKHYSLAHGSMQTQLYIQALTNERFQAQKQCEHDSTSVVPHVVQR